MYDHSSETKSKLQSLKDLKAKMKELHAHSLKTSSSAMSDQAPNPQDHPHEEDALDTTELSHQSREGKTHDDMNEDHRETESNLKAKSSHDSAAVHDNKPNPKSPTFTPKSRPEYSNPGSSTSVRDEHGGNPHNPTFTKYPHQEVGNESMAEDEQEDTAHLEPLNLHPGLAKLLQQHLLKK